ncbi:hypothetical protein FACS189437_02090 [Bacteroidia bacterium]|nr:hypothetical protein FACS189437_02090 [Bacteroidia bacterium]
MEENVKQAIALILHERMKCKAALEMLRLVEQTNIKKSYKREIDILLDRMNELNEMYEKLMNQ